MRLLLILCFAVACLPLQAQWITPISRDQELGTQVVKEIAANPKEYPILPEAQYPEAYRYLRGMVDHIMAGGQVRYAKDFQWELHIINKDVKNAFCAPAGKIYVYTGLIKYLSAEHELAGVLGHEIAHADLRHTARQMEKSSFVGLLATGAAAYAGGGEVAKQAASLATGVIGLKFSRTHESEADAASVRYLCGTKYAADGAAAFFEKIQQESGGSKSRNLSFLSTHPDPGNRIQRIRQQAGQRNCGQRTPERAAYQAFINSLPKDYQ